MLTNQTSVIYITSHCNTDLFSRKKRITLLPRSLNIISTSVTGPYFSNIALKSGSRNRNGMFDTCNRFGALSTEFDDVDGSGVVKAFGAAGCDCT